MKRQVVLRTAARMFSQRGFHQTTLTDIAEELHIAKPTLYHYFRSKDENPAPGCSSWPSPRSPMWPSMPIRPRTTGMEQAQGLRAPLGIEMIVDDFGTCLIMTGVLPLQAENRKLIRQGSKTIETMLREILRRGVADGSIARCDPKITAMFFFGSINWVPYWYNVEGRIDASKAWSEQALLGAFLTGGLGPRPAARPAWKA